MNLPAPSRALVIKEMIYVAALIEEARQNGQYAEACCDLKQTFFLRYQMGLVFSTRWNGEFFTAALPHVIYNTPLVSTSKNERGQLEPLGEWDVNFNRWLAALKP